MLRRLAGELDHPGVTHVHILGGTNDAWLRVAPEQSRRCVEKMVQICAARGVTPVLGLTTPLCLAPGEGNSFFPFGMEEITSWLDRHREWIKDYAAARAIPLIDYFTPLCLPGTKQGNPVYFHDEAHLSKAGNKKMALVAMEALDRILLA